jgi:hypothetical protein
VLAGVPLPGKANLRVRWYRDADRQAGYIPVPNPLRYLDREQPDQARLMPGELDSGYQELAQLEPA